MKVKNVLLSLIVLGYIGANAAEATTSTANSGSGSATSSDSSSDATSTSSSSAELSAQSTDELIAKMQHAKAEERYKYMNAIKAKLSKTNAKNRASKISSLEVRIESKKEHMQLGMKENSDNDQHSMSGSFGGKAEHSNSMGFGGGFGGTGEAGIGGGFGGDSDGGMGGGAGGGSAGGSGGGAGGW